MEVGSLKRAIKINFVTLYLSIMRLSFKFSSIQPDDRQDEDLVCQLVRIGF